MNIMKSGTYPEDYDSFEDYLQDIKDAEETIANGDW